MILEEGRRTERKRVRWCLLGLKSFEKFQRETYCRRSWRSDHAKRPNETCSNGVMPVKDA